MRTNAIILTVLAVGLAGSPGDGGEVEQVGHEAFEAFMRQDFTSARESAEKQWELAEAQGDRLQSGLAAANLGAVLAIAGRVDEALEWYETAEVRLRALDRSQELGRLGVARGITLYMKGEPELGDRQLARARELLGADDWRLEFVAALFQIWTRLDLWQGEQRLEELLEGARRSGDPSRIAAALMALAWVEGAMGGGEQALSYYEEAIGLFEKRDQVGSAALARRNMGVVHIRAGEPDRAESQLRQALELAGEAAELRLEFRALNDLSLALAHAGDVSGAREADLQAEAALARIAEDLRRGRLLDTPLVDYYNLLRMRYLNPPGFQIDGFPWLFDQLALAPEARDEGGGTR